VTTVALLGTGLIGGSLGLALRRAGITVQGYDADPGRLARALERGAIDVAADSAAVALANVDAAFVALPVSGIAEAVGAALAAGVPAISDVGSVKAPVVKAVEAACPGRAAHFVGGHPMAGAEGDGIEAADADLFVGATWVLTPTETTDPDAFACVRDLVAAAGAEVVAVGPDLHDAMVAIVSHVPHLVATALMHVAADAGTDHDTMLRLAAGGFRAMTRLSGRAPGIWPDICVENREAIVPALARYAEQLDRARRLVEEGERGPLLDFFERARAEVHNIPARAASVGPLVELAIPVPDRPGVLAEVTTLAGRRGVNIVDLGIDHSAQAGVLVMVVPAAGADPIVAGLEELGYRPTRRFLG
jgi:prephenate dehydrogenase